MWSLNEIDWLVVGNNALQMVIAFALAVPAGLDRERARQLGLRTIPLVAVASCGFLLLSQESYPDDPHAQARILQGVITGVGFLGGGAIVKSGVDVHGTATAATIWCTAAIGTSVAYGRWGIAVVLAVFNFVILVFLRPVGDHIGPNEKDDFNEDESDDDHEDEKKADESESS